MSRHKILALMTFVILACGVGAVGPSTTPFPLMPTVAVDSDGTLHWNERTYPVDVDETEMAAVKVSVYTAKDITPRNRRRIVMEFESDGEAIALAALGKMKVLSVHYAGAYLKSNTDIVAVYRTLLKTYKPSQIAMFGISGGCQLAANTAAWLPSQRLPFPAALGLLSCAGGGSPGDTRKTMNGFDPQLSDFTPFGAARGSRGTQPAVKPGDPEREILNVASIPKGFPPSYLLTGTRDMCLSETALLHRRLRDAGVEADLNVFEGMWHAFNIEPNLPETKSALADLARFLERHMGA